MQKTSRGSLDGVKKNIELAGQFYDNPHTMNIDDDYLPLRAKLID